jgi:hypothetical protein
MNYEQLKKDIKNEFQDMFEETTLYLETVIEKKIDDKIKPVLELIELLVDKKNLSQGEMKT